MSKRANPMRVKAALVYDVEEAATALGKTPATIRNWVKDGLPVLASCKPMLISGQAIREYLRAKYEASKQPLQLDELLCLSCGVGRKPADLVVILSKMSLKTWLLKGSCDHCGATATRMISPAKLQDFTKTFCIKEGAPSDA